MKKFFFLLAILIVTLIISRDLFKPGYFSIHDDLQVGRQYEMDLCFRDGQIPCRWVPDMGYGYGYPLFNYYPPWPYYLGEMIHGLGFNFIDSTKAVMGLGFLVSGLLMYAFTRRLWGDWGGLLSATLYLLAPYHSVDTFVRGAVNELWALAWLPGLYWASYELVENRGRKWMAILAIFFGLLLLSHNLMTLIFTPTVAVFVLILITVRKISLVKILPKFIVGGLWGFGLAAFFTLPVIFETRYVHVETMLMGYFNYLAHYVSIGKLLFTRYWGYGSSGWLQETGMPFQVGIPQWPLAILVFGLSIFLLVKRKIDREFFLLGSFFLILFLGSLFLVHPRSVFIWQSIDPLKYLQFPWRFLTLVIFSTSILGGALVYLIQNTKYLIQKRESYFNMVKVGITLLLIFVTIILNYSFFRAEKVFPMTDEQKLFSVKGWNKLQTDAIFDYLPKSAKFPPAGPAPDQPTVLSGEAIIGQTQKGSNWYKFNVYVEEKALIQVPLYNFPTWRVKINGKIIEPTAKGDLGLVTFTADPVENNVDIRLINTPIRVLGNYLTLLSWLLIFSCLVLPYSKKLVTPFQSR